MGMAPTPTNIKIQYFYSKYIPINTQECILSTNHHPNPYINLYQFIHIRQDASILQIYNQHIKSNVCSSFRVGFDDIYADQCGDIVNILLVYHKNAVPLLQILNERQKCRLIFKEQDVSYMIECIVRGIRQNNENKQNRFILTPLLILFDYDGNFRIYDAPLTKNTITFKSDYTYLFINNDPLSLPKYQQIDRIWYEYLFKIDEYYDRQQINLLSLGLISIYMLFPTFNITQLFQSNTFIYRRLLQKINMIKDRQLAWKIWLLTNQYPNSRIDIYQYLNLSFDSPISKPIIFNQTSLNLDINYTHAQIRKRLTLLNLISQPSINFNRLQQSRKNNLIQPKIIRNENINILNKNATIIKFSFLNPKQINGGELIQNRMQNENNIFGKSLQCSIDRSLGHNKLKSLISDQTQISTLKYNEENISSHKQEPQQNYKMIQKQDQYERYNQQLRQNQYLRENQIQGDQQKSILLDIHLPQSQNLCHSNHHNNQDESDNEDGINQNLQAEIDSDKNSVILLELDDDEDDQMCKIQIEEEEDDYFPDIRSKCYSIDRRIQKLPDSPPNQSIQKEDIMEQILENNESEDEYDDLRGTFAF